MNPKQACSKAIKAIGGPAAVGRLFLPAITSQAVSQWEIIPPERVLKVIDAARMHGCAITVYEARPDIYGEKPKRAA